MRSNDFFLNDGGYYSMFVRADENEPVEKENLMVYKGEDKARVKSVNKRKKRDPALEYRDGWPVHHFNSEGRVHGCL